MDAAEIVMGDVKCDRCDVAKIGHYSQETRPLRPATGQYPRSSVTKLLPPRIAIWMTASSSARQRHAPRPSMPAFISQEAHSRLRPTHRGILPLAPLPVG